MVKQHGGKHTKVLRARLRRWTETVRCLALRRGGHSRLDPVAYRALQSELIELCRQPKEQPASIHQACEEVMELVGPWITLESLAQVRRPLLDDLVERAERLQRQLAGRRPRGHAKRWSRLALPVVAELPLVILLALRCDLCPQADWLSRQLRAIEWIVMPRWLFLGANRLQNCGPVEVTVILGIAEALLLAPLLWRTKSWS